MLIIPKCVSLIKCVS